MDRLLQHLQATGKVDENPRSGMPLNTTPREDRIISNVLGEIAFKYESNCIYIIYNEILPKKISGSTSFILKKRKKQF
jgi:hypothetical protein